MTKNIKFYLFFLTTLFLLQSCSMGKYIKSEVAGQAKIQLPKHIKSVNILDKASTKKPVQRIVKVIQGRDFIDDEHVSVRKELVSKIKGAMPVSSKVLMKTKQVSDADKRLDIRRIKKFGEGADGLLCLEQFN